MYDANRNIDSSIERIDGIHERRGVRIILRYGDGYQFTLAATNERMNNTKRIVDVIADVGIE